MSERGLLLALQRLHDDPGFIDTIAADPQNTLGIYDLDEAEHYALLNAVTSRDAAAIRDMASKAGIDWTADHISGAGALPTSEVTYDSPHIEASHPGGINVTAFGADWITGEAQPEGVSGDLAKDPTGLPIKPAGN